MSELPKRTAKRTTNEAASVGGLFVFAGTAPFDTPMESMAPFETRSGPFLFWNPLTAPVLSLTNYAHSTKCQGDLMDDRSDLQLLGYLRSSYVAS
jgi:hypothetical protein